MPPRRKHQPEVQSYLQKHFPGQHWTFSLPRGRGMETYFVQGNEQRYFVKVGAALERYLAMAEIGLAPPIVSCGQLESGRSILVQPLLAGRTPSRRDFQEHWERVAGLIRSMHTEENLRKILPPASSTLHKDAGRRAWDSLCQRWEYHRSQVSKIAPFVDRSLQQLDAEMRQFSTGGLVASHNDICNANWLFTADGRIYVIDFESMSLDDPALDMGALLWWYYPPGMRNQFLAVAGYPYDDDFKARMRVRMALHCLSITLPREGSFDRFTPDHYEETLEDFRAILEGRENPQGY